MARSHADVREQREKAIADRYRQINKDLQLGQSDAKIRERARKEAETAARRASNDDKK